MKYWGKKKEGTGTDFLPRDRRRRMHVAERSFVQATHEHGFKRSRWRRLWRQKIQDWLIVAIQNVKILLNEWLRPAGVALALQRAQFADFKVLYLPIDRRVSFWALAKTRQWKTELSLQKWMDDRCWNPLLFRPRFGLSIIFFGQQALEMQPFLELWFASHLRKYFHYRDKYTAL